MVAEKAEFTVSVLESNKVKLVVLKSPVSVAEMAPFKPLGCPIPVDKALPVQEIPSPERVK